MGAFSKYSSGSTLELTFLAFPLFLSLSFSSLMSFCDRIFLSYYSLDAFKAIGIASYLSLLFQLPIIRLASMNQALIARSLGEETFEKIGPYTWQMIWCSLLTTLVFLPVSYFAGTFYFANSEVESLSMSYFSIMLIGNCVFPIGVSLAAFQVGLGKTKTLAFITLSTTLLNAFLDYFLIYGYSPLIPSLGIKGAAIATIISQSAYCGILFYLFFHHPKKNHYQTRSWKFRKDLFLESCKMGIPRAIAGFVAFLFWILSLQLVAKKGGDYLILISFGSTIWTVTSSINESINRSLVTLFSYFLGKNRWTLVWKSLKSGIILLSLIFCFLSIPFVLFNRELIHLIIGTKITGITKPYLSLACYWLWIFFFIEGIGFLSMALLTALKETLFIMKLSIILNLLLIYVPFYLAFQLNNYEPDKIWMILWLCAIATLFFNALKIRTCYLNSQFPILAGEKN